jgi:tRNA-binding protein
MAHTASSLSNNKQENTISWADFEKVDIRAGTIIHAEPFPEARKPAYKITIDFGPGPGILKTSAQVTKLYSTEDLIGKQVLAVVNFPPKQIATFLSECLLLGVVGNDGEVTLIQPQRAVDNGMKVG